MLLLTAGPPKGIPLPLLRKTLIALLVLALLGTAEQATAATSAHATATAHAKKKPAKKKKRKKKKAKATALVVCASGCKYATLQQAVDAAAPKATITVRPGKYVGGATVKGHRKDGLVIQGGGTTPRETVLEGKGASGIPAQNGILVDGADNVTMRNLDAENFVANGFFVRGVHGYVMDHVVAGFNHGYGLYAFESIGGRMTNSESYGAGDSGYYVGATVPQDKPEKTLIAHNQSYENVLGYSGTNSRYVDIRDNEFYNNGAGIVPNTLQSEKYGPADQNSITENLVYWNNFNYYKPDSPVKTSPQAVGGFNYPTGAGIVLFGIHNTTVRANLVFGNFKWGIATFSDPTYATASSQGNKMTFNTMGAAFGDENGVDFYTDGTGPGNCWENNSTGATFDQGGQPQALLYPSCSAGTPETADPVQEAKLGEYATKSQGQEDEWKKHPHPGRPDRTPIDGQPTT